MTDSQLIDKLLLEWSWRCEKGYPDLNNEEDLKLLENLFGLPLKEQEEEEQEQENTETELEDIKNLLDKNKGNKKLLTRIYRTLSTSERVGELKQRLKDAGIDKNTFSGRNLPQEIITILVKGKENSIDAFLEGIITADIGTDGNIYNQIKKLPKDKVMALVNLEGSKDSVNMGKGEILFPIIFNNVKLLGQEAGDFKIDGKTAELKANLGRLAGSRGGKPYKPVNTIDGSGWQRVLIGDIEIGRERDNLQHVIKNINKYISDNYTKSTVRLTAQDLKNKTFDILSFMAKAAVDHYLKDKNIEIYIIFDHETGDYKIYNPEQILNAVEKKEINYKPEGQPQLRLSHLFKVE